MTNYSQTPAAMRTLDPKPRPAKKRRVQIADPKQKTTTDRPKASEPPTSSPKSAKGKGKERVRTPADPPPTHPRTFKVVAGSYEKILYGLEASFTSSDDPASPFLVDLKPIFIFPAHVSCIKAVAASPAGGKWLASGSADEIIKVWDLRRRKEIGGLVHHEGSITYLTFPSRSHLLSASEDGTICLFHARDWAVLRTLKGHKGRVNCVGVHPSGKLALSVGKDRTMRMWDLMRGKGSASTKLGKEGEVVCWSPSGKVFAVQAHATIDIFSTKMALLYSITHPSRVHDVRFFRPTNLDGEPEFLLVTAEDKKVTIYELYDDIEKTPKIIAELVGHTNRVKAIDTLTVTVPPYTEQRTATLACTVSSDGFIRVFNLDDAVRGRTVHVTEQPVIIEPIAQYDTKGSRLTCVTMGDGEMVNVAAGGKRKRDEDAVAEVVEDESSGAEDGVSGGEEQSGAEVEDDQEGSD